MAEGDIEHIISKDASVVTKSGKYVSVVVIGNRATAKLEDAVANLVDLIEKKYQDKLEASEANMDKFNGIVDLIPRYFPFFKIMQNVDKNE